MATDPEWGGATYGNVPPKPTSLAETPSPSVPEIGSFWLRRWPSITRSETSMTSSDGRRPLGNPAVSPPSRPSVEQLEVHGSIDRLSRISSDRTTTGGRMSDQYPSP